MRRPDHLFRLMAALALAASFPTFAQTPADTPAPQASEVEPAEPAKSAQPTPEELKRSATMSDGERIKLCRKKRNQPLEEWEWSYPASQIGEGITAPKNIERAVPRFVHGRPGTVVLDALMDQDGCVREVQVVRSLGLAPHNGVI